MKAWEVSDAGLLLHDVEPPVPADGQVLLDVVSAGVCGSDIPKLQGPNAFDLPQPWRPGHEIVGRGTELVAVDPLVPCGECPSCLVGRTHLCPGLRRVGWDLAGGFAEQIVVPSPNTHGIDDLPLEAAVLADPMAVAVHGLRCSQVDSPANLAVIGAGAIGILTAVYARGLGIDVTVFTRRHQVLRLDGVKAVAQGTVGHRGYDVVVDAATGATSDPLEIAIGLVKDGGTIIVQNAYHPGVRLAAPLRDVFRRSIRFQGSFSFCRKNGNDFVIGLEALRDLPEAASLVRTHRGLDALPDALASDCHGQPWVRHAMTLT